MTQSSQHTESLISRRTFGKQVSLGTLLALGVESDDSCADDQNKDKKEGKPGDLLLAPERDEENGLPQVEEAMMVILLQRYPHPKLTPDVQRQIYRDLVGDLARSEVLSGFPLKNHQEPGFVFRAFRQDQP